MLVDWVRLCEGLWVRLCEGVADGLGEPVFDPVCEPDGVWVRLGDAELLAVTD